MDCFEDDNVSLTSTTWTEYRTTYSEEDQNYAIEKIIAESEDGDDKWYLLKWVGYPEERASWTHKDDTPIGVLPHWEQYKSLVASGAETSLDIEKWERKVDRLRNEMLARRDVRAAKRKRLGVASKTRSTISTRKKNEEDLEPLFEPDTTPEADSPAHESLDGGLDGNGIPDHNPHEALLEDDARDDIGKGVTSAEVLTEPSPANSKNPNVDLQTVLQVANTPQLTPVASIGQEQVAVRRTAPHQKLRKSINIFMTNTPKKRNANAMQAGHGEVEGRPEAKKRKMPTLSHIHRINKAAMNEPPPTISVEEMQAMTLHSARRRPIVPSAAPVAQNDTITSATTGSQLGRASIGAPPTGPSPSNLQGLTCFFWADGRCRETQEQCRYAHEFRENFATPASWHGGPPRYWPKSNFTTEVPRRTTKIKTCFFWADEGCSKSAEACAYAHEFLTDFALPPKIRSGTIPRKWPKSNPAPQGHVISAPPGPSATSQAVVVDKTARTMTSPTCHIAALSPRVSSAPIEASFTTEAFADLPVELHSLHTQVMRLSLLRHDSIPRLAVSYCVTDAAYRAFTANRTHAGLFTFRGSIIPTVGTDVLCTFADGLNEHARSIGQASLAGVVLHPTWFMVIYPADQRDLWETRADDLQPETTQNNNLLCFQMTMIIPSPVNAEDPGLADLSMVTFGSAELGTSQKSEALVTYAFRELSGITARDIERLFEWTDSHLARHVFLHFGSYHQDRTNLERVLTSFNIRVYQSDQPGAWDAWRRTTSADGGVVIFHPSIQDWNHIEHLSFLLNSRVTFWLFGACSDDHYKRHNTYETLQIWKLWNRGTVVLCVDDLFEHHPDRALRIVKHIAHKGDHVPRAERTWKLASRPALSRWLLSLAHDDERQGTGCAAPARRELFQLITKTLCPPELCDIDSPDTPSQVATLISEIPENFAEFADCWPSCKGEELLVSWFAMWAMTEQFAFRRFVVLVDKVDEAAEGYKARWKHIDVITPEKYLKRYG